MKVRIKQRSKKLFTTKDEFTEWRQRRTTSWEPEQVWEYVETLTSNEALLKIPKWLCTAKKRDDGKTVFPSTVAEIKKETEKALLIEDIEHAMIEKRTENDDQGSPSSSQTVWLPKSQVICYQKR